MSASHGAYKDANDRSVDVTPTPRTDAITVLGRDACDCPACAVAKLSRQLESELAAARIAISDVTSELDRVKGLRLACAKSSIPDLAAFGLKESEDGEWLTEHLDGIIAAHPVMIIRELARLALRRCANAMELRSCFAWFLEADRGFDVDEALRRFREFNTHQAGSAKAAGAPGAESTAAPTNTDDARTGQIPR